MLPGVARGPPPGRGPPGAPPGRGPPGAPPGRGPCGRGIGRSGGRLRGERVVADARWTRCGRLGPRARSRCGSGRSGLRRRSRGGCGGPHGCGRLRRRRLRRRSRRSGGAGFGSRRSRRGAAVRHGGRHRRRLLRHRYRGGGSRNRRGDNCGSRCGRRRLGRFSSAERLTKAARDGRLDRRRRGFDEFPLLAEPGENFFTRDTEFLGQLVHAGLACHYISCLEATAVVGAAPRV